MLNDKYKKSYSEILQRGNGGEEELFKEAQRIYQARLEKGVKKHMSEQIGKTIKDLNPKTPVDKLTKSISDVKDKKIIASLDDFKSNNEMFEHFYSNSYEVMKDLDMRIYDIADDIVVKDFRTDSNAIYRSIDEANADKVNKIKEVRDKYLENYNEIMDKTEKLKSKNSFYRTEYSKTIEEIETIAKEVKRYENLLNSNESFEIYMRSSEGIGEEAVNKIMDDIQNSVGKFILNPDGNFDETVAEVATFLKNEFYEMGISEIDIGKLSKGQFNSMIDMYLPHIVTPEAQKLLKRDKKVMEGVKNFGAKYGFGRDFNPHSKSRNITKIKLNGEWIENPNILQINEYFEPMLKGNKMFNESVGELYLARAVKNKELLFDNNYMNKMVDLLGVDFDGALVDPKVLKHFEKTHKPVMNYGKLRNYTSDYASKSSMLDRSEMISNHLSDPDVQAKINLDIGVKIKDPKFAHLGKEAISDMVYSEEVSSFIKTNIDPIKDKIYKRNLDIILDKTGTRSSLEQMQLPLSNVSTEQHSIMKTMTEQLEERYLTNVKKSFYSVTKTDGSNLSLDDMVEHLKASLVVNDFNENTVGRYEGLIKKIEDFGKIEKAQVRLMNSSIIEKTNIMRELQIRKDNSKFLQTYDKMTHFMKLNQTTVLPSFHTKNKAGNTFRSWLGAGEDILDLEMQKGAFNAVKSEGKYAKWAFQDNNGKPYFWNELFQDALDHGVMDEVAFGGEIGATDGTIGLFDKWIPGKFDPTNTSEFIWYRAGTKVGKFTENQDRLIHYAARIKQGMTPKHAAEMSQKFLFDYSDLTFFEQNVMKRIIPYYTWLRKNTPLQMEMLLDEPGKFRNISKILGGIEGMVSKEDRIDKRWVNDFARDWIQLPFKVTNPDGREEPVMLNPNLPMGSLNDIPDVTDISGTARNYANKLNPLLKIPAELLLNKHTYFDSPIVNKNNSFAQKTSARLNHVANQFSVYPVAKGLVTKRGADLGLHTLNIVSPARAVSYDYDKFKAMKMSELDKKRKESNSNPGMLESIKRRLGGY